MEHTGGGCRLSAETASETVHDGCGMCVDLTNDNEEREVRGRQEEEEEDGRWGLVMVVRMRWMQDGNVTRRRRAQIAKRAASLCQPHETSGPIIRREGGQCCGDRADYGTARNRSS